VTRELRRDAEGEAATVATVTLDDRRRRNPLSAEMLEQLLEALEALGRSPEVRATIVTGAGEGSFVAGADLDELTALGPATAEAFIRRIHDVCVAVRALPMPVIARIDGPCLGAGLELACSCDLRVASPLATFAMPEVQVGVPSVIEAALLPRLIGSGRSRDLVMTGRTLTAVEALEWGLIDRLSAAATLDEEVGGVVGELLEAPADTLRRQKRLCHQWEELPLADAVEVGVGVFRESLGAAATRRRLERIARGRKRPGAGRFR
jgi:enoyl-CoA hydratase/carnithine racemase